MSPFVAIPLAIVVVVILALFAQWLSEADL